MPTSTPEPMYGLRVSVPTDPEQDGFTLVSIEQAIDRFPWLAQYRTEMARGVFAVTLSIDLYRIELEPIFAGQPIEAGL